MRELERDTQGAAKGNKQPARLTRRSSRARESIDHKSRKKINTKDHVRETWGLGNGKDTGHDFWYVLRQGIAVDCTLGRRRRRSALREDENRRIRGGTECFRSFRLTEGVDRTPRF